MPELFEMKAVYLQDADCHQDDDNVQEIEISTKGIPPDFFYTIKTERWAFDDIGEIVSLISDFMKRCENTKVEPIENFQLIKKKNVLPKSGKR